MEPESEDEPNARILPWDIDLEEVQQSIQYQSLLPQDGPQDRDAELSSTIDFNQDGNDGDTKEPTSTASPATMLSPQSRRPSEDTLEKLSQQRIRDKEPDLFLLALGLWCNEAGISRSQYSSLREILAMLEPHSMLSRLPKNYGPLQRRTKEHIP